MRVVGQSIALLTCCILAPWAFSQNSWEYGGFLQEAGRIYAKTPYPSDAYTEGLVHLQMWGRAPIGKNFSFRGAFDAHIDTHGNIDRHEWLDVAQRGLKQPAGSISELYLDAKLGRVDLRLGNQRVRWGRADGFNPTDNIAPYDYLVTFDDARLSVPALKADVYFARTTLETVWLPFYTPTRLPLLGQRWFPRLPSSVPVVPPSGAGPVVADLVYEDVAGPLPARTFGNGQWGMRLNQELPRGEFSFSYFDGFDDLPYFRPDVALIPNPASARPKALVSLNREYYRIHVAGADFASEIGPIGIRGEAAYFDQTDPRNLDHLLFVIGVDKRWGDWFAIVQYAGRNLNGRISDTAVFPDLALRSTLICRVERTMGPSRTLELSGAIRLLDGDLVLRPVYSLALSNRWRLKIGGTVFAGSPNSYFGQFSDSSYLNLQMSYSW